jgi:hypothetical protein
MKYGVLCGLRFNVSEIRGFLVNMSTFIVQQLFTETIFWPRRVKPDVRYNAHPLAIGVTIHSVKTFQKTPTAFAPYEA